MCITEKEITVFVQGVCDFQKSFFFFFVVNLDPFTTVSPINREFYLAKGTEKFILGRYLLSGILLILLSLRPWGVVTRPAILENRGAKSHFCDYFIIRARYLYLSYYRKSRACNSLALFRK
jgi:hypothetical protein